MRQERKPSCERLTLGCAHLVTHNDATMASDGDGTMGERDVYGPVDAAAEWR
jgi:hypothetical protein